MCIVQSWQFCHVQFFDVQFCGLQLIGLFLSFSWHSRPWLRIKDFHNVINFFLKLLFHPRVNHCILTYLRSKLGMKCVVSIVCNFHFDSLFLKILCYLNCKGIATEWRQRHCTLLQVTLKLNFVNLIWKKEKKNYSQYCKCFKIHTMYGINEMHIEKSKKYENIKLSSLKKRTTFCWWYPQNTSFLELWLYFCVG